MREIEFRGKAVIGNKWVYGWLNATNEEDGKQHYWIDKCLCAEGGTDYAYQVDAETIGQYTGLKDKNGKKIFEGDIVDFCGSKSYRSVVKFGTHEIKCCGCCYYCHYSIGFYFTNYNEDEETFDDIEVIGNIYDNPELLGVKKNGN